MKVEHRIVVVDDDRDIGEVIVATARKLGFQCAATTDAAKFLNCLTPDTTLILLDLMMPEMDGIEVLRILAERKCTAGIVLMSSVGKRIIESAEQLAHVLDLCVVGHLQKPFQIAELEEKLQRHPGTKTPLVIQASPQFSIQREELELAIERDEFVVHYQPQIDIATGCVLGVEALVRWQHRTRGLVFPDHFISQMEMFGLIDKLGWLVANRAMSDVRWFGDCDGRPVTLSLNASVNSLCNLEFPDILVSIAERHGLSPQDITIEITETCLIKELSRTLDTLTRLRMKKIKLSIDDFGTGYAQMQQFKNIPATELKIDKSFVQEMIGSDRERIMIQKTIQMGHDLGMTVMAEGVETLEQLELLRSYACDGAQGYLFSRPISAKEIVGWLATHREELAHGSFV